MRNGELYRERPRCPAWVYLVFTLVPGVVLSALIVVLVEVLDAHTLWSSLAVVLLISVGLGLMPRLSQRVIVVDSQGVHAGGYLIPFDGIASMHPVAGSELKNVRHEIADPGSVSPGFTTLTPLVGLLALGADMVGAGLSLMRTEDRRRGMLCSPWQEPALLIETPSLPTNRWLIAASNPRRLEQAIQRGRAGGDS